MSVFFITAKEERYCKGCKKTIKVGEKMVKTKTRVFSCTQTEVYSVYYHENCWPPRKRR